MFPAISLIVQVIVQKTKEHNFSLHKTEILLIFPRHMNLFDKTSLRPLFQNYSFLIFVVNQTALAVG